MFIAATMLGMATPAIAAPEPATFPSRLDAYVAKEMQADQLAGMAIAVLRDGEVLVAKGYGLATVEHNVPVTADTIFQLGSVGKMFTSAAVMTQVEKGKIRLDDPIMKFFPDAPLNWRNITVRNLLTHTSGIPEFGSDFNYRADYSDDELVKLIAARPPSFEPGMRWSYSNTGYEILGILVKKATGRSYLEVVDTEIFKPLGMKTARGISEADIVPNRASGYKFVDGQRKNQDWVSPSMNSTADGSLYASLNDMIAWSRGVEQGKILSPAGWKETYTPVRLNSGKPYPYGFGWQIAAAAGQPRYYHGGAWQGFRTHYSRYLGDNVSVIILANQDNAPIVKIADDVAGLWDSALVAAPPRPKPEPAVAKRVAALIEVTRAGALRPADLPLAPPDFSDNANAYFAPLLKDVGALTKLELMKREELGDDVVYTYAASFGDRSLQVLYGVGPGDAVASFRIYP
ncbi:serine hydrolase [Sphingopyxis sp. JAI128]|uniref:serine hydrolase domain-containing protein n=1 Tax=Sphingopyxis sp. JAI128 TaxID=2723066 RepID=UPI001608A2E1|nr:serine hydrolase domain-containing protein [Sphingopyxis sp. JAI128]MBB6428152.1 CubicO group peptidase (beta-lactamase class C family) [Sphingopyxis sp. JAI128]